MRLGLKLSHPENFFASVLSATSTRPVKPAAHHADFHFVSSLFRLRNALSNSSADIQSAKQMQSHPRTQRGKLYPARAMPTARRA
jgi:hypothetical protein